MSDPDNAFEDAEERAEQLPIDPRPQEVDEYQRRLEGDRSGPPPEHDD
jgi:hypothetical protein